MLWRYSLRWGLPHQPCPGDFEIASAEVAPGEPCPAAVSDLWKAGTGYVVTVDFQQADIPVRRWGKEAKAKVRRGNLAKRLQRHAPLFADELFVREIERRPAYFAGENVNQETGASHADQ